MKRIIASAALAAALLASAGAQTMYDGLKYSDNNYYGTARSMALGNAMTAVGGDLGSVTLNPAGSAVAGYSQFTISQGMSFSEVGADYSPVASSDIFTSSLRTNKGRYTMPNVGFVVHMNTPAASALNSWSMGMVINTTNRTLDRMSVSGRNDFTSMTGALAYSAMGIDYSKLMYDSGYDNYSWPIVMGYQSFMIGEAPGSTNEYYGATEIEDASGIHQAGPITQRYTMQHTGSRNDMVFNIAGNFSDRIYVGFNLGVPMMSYKEDILQTELPVDQSQFEYEVNGQLSRLQSVSQRYWLDTDADGIYGQIGIIALPLENLRLGASVKTPTLYNVRERYGYSGNTTYNTGSHNAYSPDGEYRYRLVTPCEINLGIAATLLDKALLSYDYGSVNYRQMEFRSDDDSWSTGEFDGVNSDIDQYARKAVQHRFGVEYKILPYMSLRYGHVSKKYGDDKITSNAFGIGFSSNSSFYADFTVRSTKYPYSWYYPYDDYMYGTDPVTGAEYLVSIETPDSPFYGMATRSAEVGYSKSMLDCVLTLGWRF